MSKIISTKFSTSTIFPILDFEERAPLIIPETLPNSWEYKFTILLESPKSSLFRTNAFVLIIFYKKDSRDLQIITQADLISNFTQIKSDLEKIKYASAIIELVLKFTLEDDPHPRLFNGMLKILQKLENEDTEPMLQFVLFYKFFLEEIGYGIEVENCVECNVPLTSTGEVNYNHEIGFMCGACGKDHIVTYKLSSELFNKITCLSQRNKKCSYSNDELKSIITFFEKFLIYHVDEFKGLKSLQMY